MSDKSTDRVQHTTQHTQILGILIVAGLICVSLVSVVLWLTMDGGRAALFFCVGVAIFSMLAVYAGKLVVDEERHMPFFIDH